MIFISRRIFNDSTFQAKLGVTEREQINFINTMLMDKNEEIDELKAQLSKKEKLLEEYLSQHRDNSAKLSADQIDVPKISARTLSDILSINSEYEEVPEVIREPIHNTFKQQSHREMSSLKIPFETAHNAFTENEETARVPRLELDTISQSSHSHRSEHIPSYQSKKFDFTKNFVFQSESIVIKILSLSGDNTETGSKSSDVDGHLSHSSSKHDDNLKKSCNLRSVATSPISTNKTLQQLGQLQDKVDNYAKELSMKSETLQSVITEVEILRGKEEILSGKLQMAAKDLQNLQMVIREKDSDIETTHRYNVELEDENRLLREYKGKFESNCAELEECRKEIVRLMEGLNSRDLMIRRLEEMARRGSLSGESSPTEDSSKDQEIHHLQEHLKKKDKVIQQMNDDSKSLHKALETIQNKIKESGNIVQLKQKLKEAKMENRELCQTIEKLKSDKMSQKDYSNERK